MTDLPASIAIAGAWGYIGRRFLDAALARGLRVTAFDPGSPPADVDLSRLTLLPTEDDIYRADAEVFHLAVHPEHRRLDRLLSRADVPLVLVEKPMAVPGRPDLCDKIVAAADAGRPVVLYDFPELYDPLTARLVEFLNGFRSVELTGLYVQRSKDREDPANPRNRKRMVDIQYQESVHCLAFALFVTAAAGDGLDAVLSRGVRLSGESAVYAPPNPEDYPAPVDGRCAFRGDLGGVPVTGLTDFTRGAPWAKRRVVRGIGDGTAFEVEVSYLEGAKSFHVNGVDRGCDPTANSYEAVLATAGRWVREVCRDRLMSGLYPNPRFTRVTYHLSAALWRACRERSVVVLDKSWGCPRC
jgi:predicted dehydrogenase